MRGGSVDAEGFIPEHPPSLSMVTKLVKAHDDPTHLLVIESARGGFVVWPADPSPEPCERCDRAIESVTRKIVTPEGLREVLGGE